MNRALQCSSEEGKWHHCRSAGKDSEAFWRQHNKIQIMVPALLLVPQALSPQWWFRKARQFAHGCWMHPQEQRGPGCTQGWMPPTPGCRYPWAVARPALIRLPVPTFSPRPFTPRPAAPSAVISHLWSQTCCCQGSQHGASFSSPALGFSSPCSDPSVLSQKPALGVSLTPWHASLHTK